MRQRGIDIYIYSRICELYDTLLKDGPRGCHTTVSFRLGRQFTEDRVCEPCQYCTHHGTRISRPMHLSSTMFGPARGLRLLRCITAHSCRIFYGFLLRHRVLTAAMVREHFQPATVRHHQVPTTALAQNLRKKALTLRAMLRRRRSQREHPHDVRGSRSRNRPR